MKLRDSKSLNIPTGEKSEPGGKVASSGKKKNPEHSFQELLMNWMCDSQVMVEVRSAKDRIGEVSGWWNSPER